MVEGQVFWWNNKGIRNQSFDPMSTLVDLFEMYTNGCQFRAHLVWWLRIPKAMLLELLVMLERLDSCAHVNPDRDCQQRSVYGEEGWLTWFVELKWCVVWLIINRTNTTNPVSTSANAVDGVCVCVHTTIVVVEELKNKREQLKMPKVREQIDCVWNCSGHEYSMPGNQGCADWPLDTAHTHTVRHITNHQCNSLQMGQWATPMSLPSIATVNTREQTELEWPYLVMIARDCYYSLVSLQLNDWRWWWWRRRRH